MGCSDAAAIVIADVARHKGRDLDVEHQPRPRHAQEAGDHPRRGDGERRADVELREDRSPAGTGTRCRQTRARGPRVENQSRPISQPGSGLTRQATSR